MEAQGPSPLFTRSAHLRARTARKWGPESARFHDGVRDDGFVGVTIVPPLRGLRIYYSDPTLFGFAFARLQGGLTSQRAYGAAQCRVKMYSITNDYSVRDPTLACKD
jgi:hypothetical protein